jgi:hypothetical protein
MTNAYIKLNIIDFIMKIKKYKINSNSSLCNLINEYNDKVEKSIMTLDIHLYYKNKCINLFPKEKHVISNFF